jgi:polysaccharide export outer membrane protein
VRATIATVVSKVRRFTSFRSVLVFLAMLGIAALCVAQATKPILTPAPETPAPAAAPAAAAPPATSTAAAPVDASSYIIGADDVLQVTVWKEQTLSGTFPVRPDGMISMVLLGDVKAAGITPSQLATNLTAQYKKYVQDPLVTVLVQQVNSQRIFMVGEVGHVGPIAITPGMTPLQAIAAAGGLSPYAHKNRIYILRGPQGKQEKIPFNYKAALRGDNSQNIALQPNDTVVVP